MSRQIIILDNVDFMFSKNELDRILKLHNEGEHYADIASMSGRNQVEILLALIHIANQGKHKIRALSDAVLGNNFKKEYWVTGIKYNEYGIPHYKCHYFCKCGKEGNHYILPEVKEIICHECAAEIEVIKASDEKERDGWGNYFVADWKVALNA